MESKSKLVYSKIKAELLKQGYIALDETTVRS
uniref:Uncharacterized protein n=1 Tax=Lepeophtheirus salmonis TaxID=72036 RepID=A0A0K2TIT2_LEPSM